MEEKKENTQLEVIEIEIIELDNRLDMSMDMTGLLINILGHCENNCSPNEVAGCACPSNVVAGCACS